VTTAFRCDCQLPTAWCNQQVFAPTSVTKIQPIVDRICAMELYIYIDSIHLSRFDKILGAKLQVPSKPVLTVARI
jgi:hypothetical protein